VLKNKKIDYTSISVDDYFDSASARTTSLSDVNIPLPHAENDQSGRETEARSSSVNDQESERINSLSDPDNPLPHAEAGRNVSATLFDQETEADMLNMLHEKRETSHENENLETKRECKLSRCQAENFMRVISQSMDMSSFRDHYARLRSMSKNLSNMSLDC